MSRLRSILDGMNDLEKGLWTGLLLLAAGFALSPFPYLALIIPGAVILLLTITANRDVLARIGDLEEPQS